MIYWAKWDLNAAIKYGVEFLKYGSDYDISYRMTMAYYQTKQYGKAIIMAQYCNSKFGAKHEIYNVMGMSYYYAGNYELAEIALRTANTIYPNYYIYRNNFGMAYEKLGKLQEALIQYRRSVQLNSGYTKAVENFRRVTQILTQQGVR